MKEPAREMGVLPFHDAHDVTLIQLNDRRRLDSSPHSATGGLFVMRAKSVYMLRIK